MLDRAFLDRFFSWLQEATLADLEAKRSALQEALTAFRESEAKHDARFLLKHVTREILERQIFGATDTGEDAQ